MQTLKNNNLRLTNALQESTANVDEWKRQLQSYKEENQRLKNRYIDTEVAKGTKLVNNLYYQIITFFYYFIRWIRSCFRTKE